MFSVQKADCFSNWRGRKSLERVGKRHATGFVDWSGWSEQSSACRHFDEWSTDGQLSA
jgi:hypothetical protein